MPSAGGFLSFVNQNTLAEIEFWNGILRFRLIGAVKSHFTLFQSYLKRAVLKIVVFKDIYIVIVIGFDRSHVAITAGTQYICFALQYIVICAVICVVFICHTLNLHRILPILTK